MSQKSLDEWCAMGRCGKPLVDFVTGCLSLVPPSSFLEQTKKQLKTRVVDIPRRKGGPARARHEVNKRRQEREGPWSCVFEPPRRRDPQCPIEDPGMQQR